MVKTIQNCKQNIVEISDMSFPQDDRRNCRLRKVFSDNFVKGSVELPQQRERFLGFIVAAHADKEHVRQ